MDQNQREQEIFKAALNGVKPHIPSFPWHPDSCEARPFLLGSKAKKYMD